MISLQELNPKNHKLTDEQLLNLLDLLSRANMVISKSNTTGVVTSGFRSLDDHKRIYTHIARKNGQKTIRIPMGSQHLHGRAVDIADADGSFMKFCKDNISLLENAGLWVEQGTVGWVHLQTVPPKSGNRFFLP